MLPTPEAWQATLAQLRLWRDRYQRQAGTGDVVAARRAGLVQELLDGLPEDPALVTAAAYPALVAFAVELARDPGGPIPLPSPEDN